MKKLLSSLMVACLMFVATISTVGADGTVTVYKGSEVVYSTTNVIKKTGYDFTQTAVMAAGLVAVLFGAGYYAKRKQLLVK